MCLMLPGQVVSRDADSCEVQTGERRARVSLLASPDVEIGDWVLVNAGSVARRIDAEQAAEMQQAFAQVFEPSR